MAIKRIGGIGLFRFQQDQENILKALESPKELKEQIEKLKSEKTDLQLALVDLAETYESKITELQLGLVELAEGGIK